MFFIITLEPTAAHDGGGGSRTIGLFSFNVFLPTKRNRRFFFLILDQNIVAAASNSACTSVVLRAGRTRRASITQLIAQGFLSLPHRCALVSALFSASH